MNDVQSQSASPLNILVVDDNPSVRTVVAASLRRLGHIVWLAADGREGASEIARRHFDVVVTDVLMPEKDGFELIQELRRKSASTRIVAISGAHRGVLDCLDLARRLGADAVLSKPFGPSELVAAIDSARTSSNATVALPAPARN